MRRGQDESNPVSLLQSQAIRHLTKALELLMTLPDTPERAQQELQLQLVLGTPLMQSKGWFAPEVERAYARARELSQQVGETPQLFPILHGLWTFYLAQGKYELSRELMEQCLHLAQDTQALPLLIEAHWGLGHTLFFMGKFSPARQHFEDSFSRYIPEQHRSLAQLYGQEPGTVCLSRMASALWYLGFPDQARQRRRDALRLAQESDHAFSQVIGWCSAAELGIVCHEWEEVRKWTQSAIALCIEQELPFFVPWGKVHCGRAVAELGHPQEGIAQIREGIEIYHAVGARGVDTSFLTHLATIYGKIGQPREGLAQLAQALDTTAQIGERWWETETYRLKGELILSNDERGMMNDEWGTGEARGLSQAAEAEACFHTALDVARRQEAKSWELRAAMSLARLWQQQDKKQEARDLLASVYDWFTEGFDTPDLIDAKALIDELSEAV